MKVRMIEGFYGVDQMGSDSDYYLSPLAYPMTETMPNPDPLADEDVEVDITNDAGLEAWANVTFAEHTIFEMDVPSGSVVKEDLPEVQAADEAAEHVARAVVALYPHQDSLGSQREALDGLRDELLAHAARAGAKAEPGGPAS